MVARTFAVVLLTAAVTPPARPADDPKKQPPTPEERAAKAEAEVKRLTEELKKLDKALTEATGEANKLGRDLVAVQSKLKRLQTQNETLTDQVKDLRNLVVELAKGARPLPRSPVPVPENLRGKVTHVQGVDPQTGIQGELVQFDLGLDAGLRRGAVLGIYRGDGKDQKLVGNVTVDTVYPKYSVGVYLAASGKPLRRLNADEFPKVGDTVGPMKDEKADPKPGEK